MRYLILAVALFFSSRPSTHALTLLSTDFNTGRLYDVDVSTGAVSNPRNTGIFRLGGLAFSPVNGLLYALRADITNQGRLYTINPTTGAAQLVGLTGFPVVEGDLAFDPVTNVLYGMYGFGPSLFTIDPSTGAGTVVGNHSLSLMDLSAMAFDTNGNLFVLDQSSGVLATLDKSTGQTLTSVTTSISSMGSLAGMVFDPATGHLLVVNGNAGINSPPLLVVGSGPRHRCLYFDWADRGRSGKLSVYPRAIARYARVAGRDGRAHPAPQALRS